VRYKDKLINACENGDFMIIKEVTKTLDNLKIPEREAFIIDMLSKIIEQFGT
jgi:hypothetical protein